ncbi:MAG: 2-C-methyl-D-erythritol 4-phosphate cytidylyltransferase, partial [Coprobacter sp.]|nr:2-C-methyl-D-erythritol 4-phosphate cytidylyltransferase [Coprobacter sp.]
NAITSLQSQESYMQVEKKGENKDIETYRYILREDLLRAQTPHTFHLKELKQMVAEAEEKDITYSQSIFTLACELGHVPLYPAKGEMINFKLTLPSDIMLFQAIINQLSE